MSPRPSWFLVLALLASSWPALSAGAASSNGIHVDVTVCGYTASETVHRGRTYVEAQDGCEYAIRVTNNTRDRVALHVAVDGLNTIDASKTAPANGPRWVLEPWASATITGWQTGTSTARKFYFTEADSSYAEWVGDTSEVGKIEVVAYRERRPPPPPVSIDPNWDRPYRGERGRSGWDGDSSTESRDRGGWGDAEAAEEAVPQAGSSAKRSADAYGGASRAPYHDEYRWDDDRASTGIGREVSNQVHYTSFDSERWSFASVTVRYGFYDQLVAWGVYPHHPPCCWRCDDGFSPDPYDRCWR